MPSKLTPEIWPVSNASVQPGVENEDAVLTFTPTDPSETRFSGTLTVIAACQGGSGKGHVYSQYVARKVMAEYYGSDEPDLGLRLENAFAAANTDLFSYSQQRPELVKPSVSLTAIAVRGEAMSIAWVGDNRAYLIRDGKPSSLTRDHTLVQQLVDEGAVTPDEARDHPRRSVLLRAIGTQETVTADVIDQRLRPDDAVVMVTSAVLKSMDDEDIATVVASKAPQNAAEMLVQQARALGSKDTITVVAALLRDGAPAMISSPPFTWDRGLASFDQQVTLAVPRQAVEPPTGAAPTEVSPRVPIDRTSPAAQTQISARQDVMPQDLQSTPSIEPPPVQPAPTFQTPVQPAPPYPQAQPAYPPPPPPMQQSYGGYAQPPAASGYVIDPVTGLPPVPQGPGQPAGWGGQQGGYQPRYYQQAGQPNYAAPARRGPSIGTFAIVGALAILATAVMVILLVNPFDFELPAIGAPPSPTATSTTPPTPVVIPTTPVPVDQVTQPAGPPTTQATPPGMKLITGGAYTRGVPDSEYDTIYLQCIDEADDNNICNKEWFSDATPVESVTLSPYYMDITEVTNRAYAACVAAGICTTPRNTQFYNDPAYAEHPVVYVSWEQAGQYCLWSGKRLPTEAEWEKAARFDPGTQKSNIWPWGDSWEPGRANTFSAGQNGTAPVASFAGDRSPLGIQDMAGNVSEWVSDWYSPTGYTGFGTLNPTGQSQPPPQGPNKVARGGSFADVAAYARGGHRLTVKNATAEDWLGFRCALTVEGAVPASQAAPTAEASVSPTAADGITPTVGGPAGPSQTPVP